MKLSTIHIAELLSSGKADAGAHWQQDRTSAYLESYRHMPFVFWMGTWYRARADKSLSAKLAKRGLRAH
jgi:hypothetical protein